MDATGLRLTTPSGQLTVAADRSHVVGRGRDCDVVIADGRVSRRHVLLEPRGTDGWLARDVSSNGIWSGGVRTSSVPVTDGEVRVHLGAADGPVIVLAYTRPPQADPDVADQETMLAGQGNRAAPPVPAAGGRRSRAGGPAAGDAQPPPGWPAPPQQPARVPAQDGAPGSPELVGAGAPAPAPPRPAPSLGAVWLRALPTFVWLGAVGFAIGALIALS